MDVYARTAANRLRLADFFDSLDHDQLGAQSLCGEWTVREVLGHLVMPMATGARAFVKHLLRARGSLDRASVAVASELSRRPVGELTALLRDKADLRVKAPGVGPMGQFADGCIHLRDCARPLGLDANASLEDWRALLDWLPSGVPGLVPKGRAEGVRLVATDQAWSWGSGDEVRGASEALAMVLAGRTPALADLDGGGVDTLRARLAG